MSLLIELKLPVLETSAIQLPSIDVPKVRQRKIFNHDIMACTHEEVIGNHLYGGRVLGLTEPDDLVQLHPNLKSQWHGITEHYARIGLSHSQNPIWDVSLNVAADYPSDRVSLFFFGNATANPSINKEWFHQIDSNWFNVVQFINSKNNFIQLAQKLGVSVPKTVCFENKAAIHNPETLSYPCYLKPAISVDGAGICRCDNPQELNRILATLPEDLPLQIQEALTAVSFLNLQYCVTPDGVKPLAASEQILDGYAHIGNRYPTQHQPWDIVEPMAVWMAQQGMKDVFAFDVAVVENAGETRYLAIECNPRFNGASYPTLIANKLNIKSWSCQTFTTSYRSIERLDIGDIEFNAKSGTGIVIVNWGTVLVGKVAVLLAGSIEEQQELQAILKRRL